MTEGLMTLTLT